MSDDSQVTFRKWQDAIASATGAAELMAKVLNDAELLKPITLIGTPLDLYNSVYNELAMHYPELDQERLSRTSANVVCRLNRDNSVA